MELHDHLADHFSGGFRFWPFPNKDYLYNAPILQTINAARMLEEMYKKNPQAWNKKEDEMFTLIERLKKAS